MHFKYPEILYALFALLLPILIHLFQLQRFVKVPFTNVKFLKQLELQTRKSSKLKKYLVLLSRLLALAALIIAFAQPYFSKNDTSKDWEIIFYLDNSLSMQSHGSEGELLKQAVRNIVENLPEKGNFALMTHDNFWTELDKNALKASLKEIKYSGKTESLSDIILKAQQHFKLFPNANHKLFWISDLQKNDSQTEFPKPTDLKIDFIQLQPKFDINLSIDTVYVSDENMENKTLTIKLHNQGKKAANINISAKQNAIILAKTSILVPENQSIETQLQVTGNLKQVKIELDYEDAFIFDNSYNISFQELQKTPVLVITEAPGFLNKIYTDNEFELTQKTIKEVSADLLKNNTLVVINEVKEIPENAMSSFLDFVKNGGSLALIPREDSSMENLNTFFTLLNISKISQQKKDSLLINKIHFEHPLFQNVFEKQVSNFQYPASNTVFESVSNTGLQALSFEDLSGFITQFNVGKGKFYWFASPLNIKNSNFINSPLVVPVFYNMAKLSKLQNQLSYRIGQINEIPVEVPLQKDEVLHLVSTTENIIPQQQIHPDFVTLITDELPNSTGFFSVKNKEHIIETLAFNTPKSESKMQYWTKNEINAGEYYNNVPQALNQVSDTQNVLSYFKWFVILALLFLLIEIGLIKYM